MDFKTFGSVMMMLQSMYCELESETLLIYKNRFKSFSNDQFKQMAAVIIDTFVPTSTVRFPTPAHFLKAVGLDDKSRAALAVGAVKKAGSLVGPYNSVSFGDRAIHATINHFGGWIEVCSWDDKKWSFNETKFMEHYTAQRSQNNGPEKLLGVAEDYYYNNSAQWLPEVKKNFEDKLYVVQMEWIGYIALPINNDHKKIEQKECEGVDLVVKDLSDRMTM